MKRIVCSALLALATTLSLSAAAQPVQGLIIQLKPSAQSGREMPQAARERVLAAAQTAGIGLHSDKPIGSRLHLLRMPAPLQGEALDAALRRLRLHPEVAYVEPDVRIKRKAAVPNDPLYADQWHLQTQATFAGATNMPPAWDLSTGTTGPGAPATIALLDSGVRFSHPDLAGRLLAGYDFASEAAFANDGDGRDPDASDPGDWVTAAEAQTSPFVENGCLVEDSSWHGTFIAGLIAAVSNNSTGVTGVNWNARILPVRVFGKCGALLSDILDGIRWAAGLSVAGVPANPTPARIINLSFGGDSACSPGYQAVIDEVTAAGALVVAAAGNEAGVLRRPADCNNVLAVAGAQSNGLKASYSNMGTNVALMAPSGTSSRAIISTDNAGQQGPTTDSYGAKIGTSFSSPLVAAVASLMLSVNPALTPAQLTAQLKATTRPHVVVATAPMCVSGVEVACNCTTAQCGTGLLDAHQALAVVAPGAAPVAAIAPVAEPLVGSAITLDGRNSTASAGRSIVAYQWRQASGPAVTIESATTAVATVQLPGAAASFGFELLVTDNSGASSVAVVTVTSVAPAGGGGGGGSTSFAWGLGLWALALLALMGLWRQRRAGGH